MTFYSTFSASDAGLVKRAKELLSHHGFGSDPLKGISTDYNRPLLIPAWSDSMESITGLPANQQSADTGGINNKWRIEFWKHQYVSRFPQSVRKTSFRHLFLRLPDLTPFCLKLFWLAWVTSM